MKKTTYLSRALWLTASILLGACQINKVECDQDCYDHWLDGGQFPDSCGLPGNKGCRVSTRLGRPITAADSAVPVIIAAHGFTATTYEWEEFKNYCDKLDSANKVNVSLILLGGHGRSVDDFQASTWKDWGRPILEEYDSLVAMGYKNISLAGSSTGGALLLEYIGDGAFDARRPPNWYFMIDPIVVPTSKLLSLVDLVGPILGNSPNPVDSAEQTHWYQNRPAEDLQQLYQLINGVKNRLEEGFEMPPGSQAKVFKSKVDNAADPVSALLIYQGMSKSGGGHIEVEMEDSKLHVFTRLQGRSSTPTPADSALQLKVFADMTAKVRQHN